MAKAVNYFNTCVNNINGSIFPLSEFARPGLSKVLRVSALQYSREYINGSRHCGLTGNFLVAMGKFFKTHRLIVDPLKYPQNPTLTNLVKPLLNNKSDIMLGLFGGNLQKFELTDFSPTLGQTYAVSILSQINSDQSSGDFKFLSVFDAKVWLLVLTTYIFAVTFNIIIKKSTHKHGQLFTNISDIFWVYFHIFLSKSCSVNVKFKSLINRWIFADCLLTTMIFVVHFNTELLSQLVNDPVVKIDTIGDVLSAWEKKDMKIVVSGGLTRSSILASSDSQFEQLEELIEMNLTRSDSERRGVINGTHIIISASVTTKEIRDRYRDYNLYIAEENYFFSPIVYLYRKHWHRSQKEILSQFFLFIFESGLYDVWYHDGKQSEVNDAISHNSANDISNILISFANISRNKYIFCLGVFISLFVLLVEILTNYTSEKLKKKLKTNAWKTNNK